MTCKEFEEILADALAGEETTEAASAHLRECASCRGRTGQMVRMHEGLLRALGPAPEAIEQEMKPLIDQVAKDLRVQSGDLVEPARRRIDQLPRRGSPWGSAIAASVAAAAILVLIYVLRPRPQLQDLPATAPVVVDAPPARIEKMVDPIPAPPPREALLRPIERPPEPEPPPPPPLPPEPEKPKDPAPVEPPPRKTPGKTVAIVGRLEKLKGSVFLAADAAPRIQAKEGQDLVTGQSLTTEGGDSVATLALGNSLMLSLDPNAALVFETPMDVAVARGRVGVDASRASGETALNLSTAHAKIQLSRGTFKLNARPESTYFETRLGSAKFTNLQGGAPLLIPAGQFAAAPLFPGLSQERVDKAIKDGIEYLRKSPSPPVPTFGIANSDPLILLTLLHAGVPENDPKFQQLLQAMLKAPIDRNYIAALQAMVLEELDRVRYQSRIVACAQMLVDNQCPNGQWSYGTPTNAAEAAFVDPRPNVATAVKLDPQGRRIKPKLLKRVVIQKTRDGPPQGDNSNAQYAALGLRACLDAGVMIPAETLHLAARWWRECQFADKEDRKTAYGGKGWCYHDGKGKVNGVDCCKYTYAGMTTGAVGSLVIYDHVLGKDWKSDPNVRSGLEWLTTNFSVTRNLKWGKEIPGDPEDQGAHFYYLYALERLGVYTGLDKLGKNEWYPQGAAVIVERQREDGSWLDIELSNHPVWDTCFAILFLRRATRPLVDVASVDRVQKR